MNHDNGILLNTEDTFVANNVRSSEPNIKEISTVLPLLRHRHSLSKSCINDLCNLLRSIERNLKQNRENTLQSQNYFVCPRCNHKCANSLKCQNENCGLSTGFV